MLQFQDGMTRLMGNGKLTLALCEHTRAHCDCCASDLPAAYCEALVYDQSVRCCSGRCLARLIEVWKPTRRKAERWPGPLAVWVACVTMLALWL